MQTSDIIEDLIKAITIIFVGNCLLVMVDNKGELLDGNTLKTLLYVCLGITIYHLVIKKFIITKISNKKKKSQ